MQVSLLSPSGVFLGPLVLPMPEPKFFPNGLILYSCPLGCWWELRQMTPRVFGLDQWMTYVRDAVSDHYRTTHGIIDG